MCKDKKISSFWEKGYYYKVNLTIEPLFSFVALVREGKHLLSATLDTLYSQTDRRFEVILIDATGSGKLEEIAKTYPELAIQVHLSEAQTISQMMNEGARHAKGRYLQFLYPGDRYLSQEGVAYLSELVKNNREPQLIYSGFLMQESEAVHFSLELPTLQKGVFSRDCWFLKQAVLDLGGFDAALSYRSSFELLCRIFLKKEMKTVCTRRILTDCERLDKPSRAIFGYAIETSRILFRYFGLWSAIRWIFVQDHLRMLEWVKYHVKKAFFKEE